MNTATNTLLARSRVLWHAAAAMVVAGLAPSLATAVNPPTEATAPTAPMLIEGDPYLVFLESMDTRNPLCREHSQALRALLAERERVVREFLRTLPAKRDEVARTVEEIDRRIDDTETLFEASVAASEPTDAPNLAPPPVIDIEAIREQSKRWRRPIYLPLPPPLVIPPLPAPPSESLYLDYLTVRAGDSKFAQDLVADVAHLLHERRELAFRHSRGRAHERAQLETTIRAVSLHVRFSAAAAAAGATISNW